jgi:NitT/TauT family transport system permease protein
VKRLRFVVALLALWQLVALSGIYPELLFPGLPAIGQALVGAVVSGEAAARTAYSLYLVGVGLVVGAILAFALVALSILNRPFAYLMESVVSVLHPLPGIALLPIVLLWFGTGSKSIIVVIVHSVLWPLAVNADTGFRSIPSDLIDAARVFGYGGLPLVTDVMFPSALPYILAGVRIAWARSWRALVAAEMVFGAQGGEGGLGWLIYQHRYFMDTPGVFAGLVCIIVIGVIVDYALGLVERHTIEAWGVTMNRH